MDFNLRVYPTDVKFWVHMLVPIDKHSIIILLSTV